MKIGTKKVETIQGRKVEMSYIGKGMFCRAFRSEDNVYLFADKPEWGKEALTQIAYKEHPHIAQCETLGFLKPDIDDPDETIVYLMPFYQPLRAQNKEAWAQWKRLKELMGEAQDAAHQRYGVNRWPSDDVIAADYNTKFLDLVLESDLTEDIKEAIEILVNSAGNMGGAVSFEFKKGSCSISMEGKLILRDVLFDREEVGKR